MPPECVSCFRRFSGELPALTARIRHTVRQWTGIPVSIGIGPTKTLAKAANRIAKIERTGTFRD
jgi:nucleotidyltransferase/DNA polymerase involved in DNA repair